MAKMLDLNCDYCQSEFTARAADRARGWARFCSKSCKAKKQEQRTGQNARFKERSSNGYFEDDDVMDDLSDMDFGASDGGGYESIN